MREEEDCEFYYDLLGEVNAPLARPPPLHQDNQDIPQDDDMDENPRDVDTHSEDGENHIDDLGEATRIDEQDPAGAAAFRHSVR